MKLENPNGEITVIKNISVKLRESSGIAAEFEFWMRIIGEHSDEVQKILQTKKFKYWNCNLSKLEDAIFQVYKSQLTPEDMNHLQFFRKIRNKLLHAEYVAFMELIDIEPSGRQISKSGRNKLWNEEILESLKSVERNRGFETFKSKGKEAITILENKIVRHG